MMRADRGLALVLVLWATVALSLIAGSFAYGMRGETALTRNLLERARAGLLADAGIRLGIAQMVSQVMRPGRRAGDWRMDGTTHVVSLAGGHVRVGIRSERGKIDLNAAPRELLAGLGSSLGAKDPDKLAARILDWRDPDTKVHNGGAEDADYEAAGLSHGAGDRAFASVTELGQVLAIEVADLRKLLDLVTVYSGSSQIDAITASRDVLVAVPGLSKAVVDRYIDEREALAERGKRPSAALLSAGEAYLIMTDAASAKVGLTYTVQAQGVTDDGTRVRKRAVVQLTGDRARQFSVLAWSDAGLGGFGGPDSGE